MRRLFPEMTYVELASEILQLLKEARTGDVPGVGVLLYGSGRPGCPTSPTACLLTERSATRKRCSGQRGSGQGVYAGWAAFPARTWRSAAFLAHERLPLSKRSSRGGGAGGRCLPCKCPQEQAVRESSSAGGRMTLWETAPSALRIAEATP